MRPSYADLLKIIQDQNRLIEVQRKTIARLEKRVAELEERLNLNSNNSSKPPSSDQKKNKQSPKGGAVKGHPGHSRKLFPQDKVQTRVVSSLHQCEHCGCRELVKKSSQIFQQIDLPKIEPIVTQIECERAECLGCKKHLIAPFPEEYAQSSFGPNIISLIALCSSVYRMSKRNIQSLLQTLFQVEISLGSIPAMERKVSKGLEPAYNELQKETLNSSVAYVDETSFREQAKTHYVWTATTAKVALIRILPTRGIASLSEIRPRGHPGITVTDRYQVYQYPRHQYCLAHLRRDFQRFAERKDLDGELGKRVLFELDQIFIEAKQRCRKTLQQRVGYHRRRLQVILEDIFANGSDRFSRLAERLLDRFHKLFVFTRFQGVECTNNAAERTLRHIVLWRKTSYGTQSSEGSRFLERAITVWMTLKKQRREVLSYFRQAYMATFQPDVTPPPILLPR